MNAARGLTLTVAESNLCGEPLLFWIADRSWNRTSEQQKAPKRDRPPIMAESATARHPPPVLVHSSTHVPLGRYCDENSKLWVP
mmetsp:Transcript_5765/g.15473  ORF Transcript_5765/g.15473 Transcript_5765/m.15473 type:complete len:84 (+) Transcript_5765:357-608(+)